MYCSCWWRVGVPTYAKIKIPNTSPAYKYTQRKIPFLRIRDEIKYLHSKKQQLNAQIYNLHLILADTWDKAWPYIQHVIEDDLQEEMKTRYRKLDRKLNNLTQTQTITPKQNHTFYPRVVNNTDITFTDHELSLLQKGPKYNLHTKRQNWIQNLALEAETAISQLPTSNRDVYRGLVAERINTLQQNNKHQPTRNTHHEAGTIRTIQSKLRNNNAMITRADKGNSLVILPTQMYESKVHDFLQANQFQTISTDPTKSYQTQIRKTIHNSRTLIPHDSKWKYTNMNPSA